MFGVGLTCPLTLTLSPEGAREQPLETSLKFGRHGAEHRLKPAHKLETGKAAKTEKHQGKRIVFLEMP